MSADLPDSESRMSADPGEQTDDLEPDDLADFVHRLSVWHARKVDHLRSIQENVKEGTILKVGEDDEDGRPMTERDAVYFNVGLEAALMELGTLPFTVSETEEGS